MNNFSDQLSDDSIRSISDTSGRDVARILSLNGIPSFSTHRIAPFLLDIINVLRRAQWHLDPKWQSPSHIHQVLRDLHDRQHFTHIHLMYMVNLRLVLILGKEPSMCNPPSKRTAYQGSSSPPEKRIRPKLEPVGSWSDEHAHFRTSEQPGGPILDACDRNISNEKVEATVDPLDVEKINTVVVIPGNCRSATISGSLRKSLRLELATLKSGLEPLGVLLEDGWLLAITDTEDVAYYVEKSVTLSEIMDATRVDGTRDSAFCAIFGMNRGINVRSVLRKDERRMRKRRVEGEKMQSDGSKTKEIGPGKSLDGTVDCKGLAREVDSDSETADSDGDKKYDDTLNLIQ